MEKVSQIIEKVIQELQVNLINQLAIKDRCSQKKLAVLIIIIILRAQMMEMATFKRHLDSGRFS